MVQGKLVIADVLVHHEIAFQIQLATGTAVKAEALYMPCLILCMLVSCDGTCCYSITDLMCSMSWGSNQHEPDHKCAM